MQAERSWSSRWISVLPLRELQNGRTRYGIFSASDNHPDEYRRLLLWLRLRGPAEAPRVTN